MCLPIGVNKRRQKKVVKLLTYEDTNLEVQVKMQDTASYSFTNKKLCLTQSTRISLITTPSQLSPRQGSFHQLGDL